MRVQLKIDLVSLRSKFKVLSEDKPDESKKQFTKQTQLLKKKLEIATRIENLSFELRAKAQDQFNNGVIPLEELNKLRIEAERASLRVVELEAEILEKEVAASEWSRPVLVAIQQTGLGSVVSYSVLLGILATPEGLVRARRPDRKHRIHALGFGSTKDSN